MRLTYKQRLLIFFLVITVSILSLFIITYNANVENNNDRHWVQHSYDVILTLTRTRSNLKDNVLACNRFLATKEVSLLPLIGAQKEVAITGFGQLTELTADNPQQQELLFKIGPMLTQRLALTDSLVHACQTKPALHAELVKHNAASELIPRIAELIRRIEDNERKLLAERLLHFEQGSRRYWSFAWVAVLLLMLFSATSFVIIARQAKKLEKAKADTQKLNEELEDRVNYKVSQLKEQEEVYGRMLDNMMEGVQMIGFDWTYLYLNDVAVRHSKLSREELIGRAIYDVYPAIKDTPLYKVLQDCMNERKQAAIENEFEYPDGQKGYFELLVEPTIEGLMILSMDISERKTRELERTRKGEEVREIVYKISHDIRQPITSILGVSYMLRNEKLTQNELKMVIHEMQESIEQLDERTHGLTEFIQSLRVQDYTSDESAT